MNAFHITCIVSCFSLVLSYNAPATCTSCSGLVGSSPKSAALLCSHGNEGSGAHALVMTSISITIIIYVK